VALMIFVVVGTAVVGVLLSSQIVVNWVCPSFQNVIVKWS